MNRQNIIDECAKMQGRLSDVSEFFARLEDSLPGEWNFTVMVDVSIFCSVGSMEDWRTVRNYFGNQIFRKHTTPLVTQHDQGAERSWVFNSTERDDNGYPRYHFYLGLDPLIEGGSCKLVEAERKEIIVWDVECKDE